MSVEAVVAAPPSRGGQERSRSPQRPARKGENAPSYASTEPCNWVIQRSPTHGNYHNIFAGPARRAPALFAFFKELEWSRVPFEPRKEDRRPLTINLDVQSEDQLAFLRAVDTWAVGQIAAHSEALLGVQRTEAEIERLAIYRKPWYEPPDGKYSPRVDARLLLTGPTGLLTEITTVKGMDGADESSQTILKGVGEDHFRTVAAQLVQWRDHRVRAVLRADSFRVFDDKTGQRKVALSLTVKELHVAMARKGREEEGRLPVAARAREGGLTETPGDGAGAERAEGVLVPSAIGGPR